jgi:PAS domain S-box-containing protein
MAEKNQKMNQEFVKYAFTMLEKNDKLSKLNLQLEESYDQLKTITEMLEFSENKYSALFDNISDFIWTCDNINVFTYVNDVMCETLGYYKKELIGVNCKNIFLSVETVDEVSNIKEEMDFTKKDYHNINILVKCKSGEEKIFSANSKKIFDGEKLIGSQGTARTIMFEEIIQTKILRKNKEFETIKEIILSFTKVNNLQELLNTVSKNVYQLFSPELCTIRTYNNGYLEFFNKTGEYETYKNYPTFHIDDDCSGDAIKENKIIRISDFENSKFANREEFSELFERIEELITVPIMVKEEPFGTIHLCMKEKLKDSDMKILKTLSNQASIAVDKLKLYDSLKEDYINTIRVLASAVEAKDKYTEGHSLRVSKIAYLIGEEMKFKDSELEELEIAGTLHDIGKIGIDDEILTKEGTLTLEEYLTIKEHPAIGEKILRPIGLSKNIIEGVLFHHKRYDLNGYPEAEKLDELGKFPSIIGVADALDAMTSNRTYAKSRSLEEAMTEIYRCSATQFNPDVVEALSNIIKNRRDDIIDVIKL